MMFFNKIKPANRKVSQRPILYRMKRSLLDQLKLWGVVGIVAGFLALSYKFLFYAPQFDLQEVEFSGNFNHLTHKQLVQLADIPFGENLLSMNLKQLRIRLQKDPWAHNILIRRIFPNKLAIVIDEYEPVALLEVNVDPGTDKNQKDVNRYYVNDRGRVFDAVESGEEINLPLITGFTKTYLKKYPLYYGPQLLAAMEFLKTFLADSANQQFTVTRLHYDEFSGYTVHLAKRVPPDETEISMTVFFGLNRRDEQLASWHLLVDRMQDSQTWFKVVDLHIEGKIFAQMETHGSGNVLKSLK